MSEHTRHRPPGPGQIGSWEEARRSAARWMQHWGFDDATVTSNRRNDEVGVTSSSAIAQVQFRAASVGVPMLQHLVRARRTSAGKQLLCFTDAGYTKQAVGYAELLGMSLFTYDESCAQVVPRTRAARALMKVARRRDTAAAARERQPALSSRPGSRAPSALESSPPVHAPLTTSPLVAGQPSDQLPNVTSAGCLAVLTLIAATLLQVGMLDAVHQHDGMTWLIAVVSLLGAGAYVVGVLALFMAVVTNRREGRTKAPAAAVLVSSAPGVTLWTGMGLYIQSGQGSAAGLLQAVLMTIPLLALITAALWPLGGRNT